MLLAWRIITVQASLAGNFQYIMDDKCYGKTGAITGGGSGGHVV